MHWKSERLSGRGILISGCIATSLILVAAGSSLAVINSNNSAFMMQARNQGKATAPLPAYKASGLSRTGAEAGVDEAMLLRTAHAASIRLAAEAIAAKEHAEHVMHITHLAHLAHLAHLRAIAQQRAIAARQAVLDAKRAAAPVKRYTVPAAPAGSSHANGHLSPSQVGALWLAAGGPSWAESSAEAIAMCESGDWTGAYNPSGATGLFQILGAVVPGNLYDGYVNALNAVSKFKSSGDSWAQWVCQP